MQITELTVYYRNKTTGERESITEKPISEDTTEIKVQVGKMIKKIQKKALYYYVVVGAEKNNGAVGYRTIIPKTLVA